MKKFTLILSASVLTIVLAFYMLNTDSLNAQEKDNPVYEITSVDKPVKGKVVDFSFMKDGKEVKFSEVSKNKVVFLNFWGTWCPPCKREIPDIIKLQKDLSDKNFEVYGVALEKPGYDPVDRVESYSDKKGINYINFIDPDNELNKAYGGIRAVPTTLIVDRDGKIIKAIQGARSYDQFLADIKKVL